MKKISCLKFVIWQSVSLGFLLRSQLCPWATFVFWRNHPASCVLPLSCFAVVAKNSMKSWNKKTPPKIQQRVWVEEEHFSGFKRKDHLSQVAGAPRELLTYILIHIHTHTYVSHTRTRTHINIYIIYIYTYVYVSGNNPVKKKNYERIYQARVLHSVASKLFICRNQKCVSHVPGEEGKRESP